MNIAHTRSMVRAALDGALADVATRIDPIFGVEVPLTCPDVPASFLDPRSTWADPDAYDRQAASPRRRCSPRTSRPTPTGVTDDIRDAGPLVSDPSAADVARRTTRAPADAAPPDAAGRDEPVPVEVGHGRDAERQDGERAQDDRGGQHDQRPATTRSLIRRRPMPGPTAPVHATQRDDQDDHADRQRREHQPERDRERGCSRMPRTAGEPLMAGPAATGDDVEQAGAEDGDEADADHRRCCRRRTGRGRR